VTNFLRNYSLGWFVGFKACLPPGSDIRYDVTRAYHEWTFYVNSVQMPEETGEVDSIRNFTTGWKAGYAEATTWDNPDNPEHRSSVMRKNEPTKWNDIGQPLIEKLIEFGV